MAHDDRTDNWLSDPRLSGFAEDVRRAYVRPVTSEIADRHLAAVAAEYQAMEGVFVPAAARATTRRRFAVTGLAGKVAAAALGLTVATGAAAAAGALPAPAQDAVAKAAQKVGFTVPSSEEDAQVASEDATNTDGDEQDAPAAGQGKRVDGAVRDVSKDDSLEGRDKGEAVSGTASQNRQDTERRPTTPARPTSGGAGNNPTDHGSGSAPDGQQGSPQTGSDRAEEGQSRNPTGKGRPAG
ncbi:MAG TPA: hypothetical protein VM840_13090 [Actinomycetota bacterium]|nr:hypothetical protein [Actinomycetota bacterium]